MSSITSYAQNFEDVMLWRALSHVGEGFYIDVGAQDPLVDSVSLLFHERGWRGVHVEPTPYYADLLRQGRPGDIVVQAAVGLGQDEILPFFEIPQTGISTADPEIAERHRANGLEVREIRVPCITLASVFQAANRGDIHWLKIDVEGFERQVLYGWGVTRVRPWIVVVESTLPLTRIESHQGWEPLLLGYGYRPVYFDGLNRYYVSLAHPELEKSFSLPPNIFDDFALNGTANAPFHRLIVARDEETLKAARNATQTVEARAASDAEKHRSRIEELESALSHRQQEIVSRADEVVALAARYQAEIQAARSDSDAVRAQAASAATDANARLRELESAAVRERQAHALRVHELTVELRARLIGLDVSARAAREKETRIIEQGELLQASARREQFLLGQVEALQAELTVSRAVERELNGRLGEHQAKQQKELDDTRHALHAAELANQLQAQSLKQGESRERRLEQTLTDLGEQLSLERKEAVATEAELAEMQALLAGLKHAISWRLTTPFELLRCDFGPPVVESRTLSPQIFPAGSLSPVQELEGLTPGALFPMSPSTDDRRLIGPAADISRLLALPHEDFVECAYRTIFSRGADADGLAHYTARVLIGHPKIEILRDLYRSDEARRAAVSLPWLQKAIARYEWRAFLLRFIFRKRRGQEGLRAGAAERVRLLEERLNYFERQSRAVRDELTGRIAQIEEKFKSIKGVAATATTQHIPAKHEVATPAATPLPVLAADTSIRRRDSALLGKSLVTKRIFRDLSAAIGECGANDSMRSA